MRIGPGAIIVALIGRIAVFVFGLGEIYTCQRHRIGVFCCGDRTHIDVVLVGDGVGASLIGGGDSDASQSLGFRLSRFTH